VLKVLAALIVEGGERLGESSRRVASCRDLFRFFSLFIAAYRILELLNESKLDKFSLLAKVGHS